MDGLRLEGRFDKKLYISPPIRLVLHNDRRFEEELFQRAWLRDHRPGFSREGSGTDEVFKWALIFRFPDGTVRTANLKYDPAKPDVLLLHATELKSGVSRR